MAVEALSIFDVRTKPRSGNLFAEAAYVAFLLLIFVSLSPFAVRDPVTLAAGESGFAGAGDAIRQIVFLGTFALIAISAFRNLGAAALRSVSPSMILLLAWCILSASWAAEPDVSFRRAVLAAIIVVSAMASVSAVGPQRALALLRHVLAGVLIVNWLSIMVVPQAVHLAGETDPGLIGNWRGLYFHKNIAGSVTAISAIIFFFEFLRSRRLIDFALFVAAVVFTAMTHSKSSIGLLPVGLVFGLVYRSTWSRGINRTVVVLSAALLVVVGITIIAVDWTAIARMLEDPTQFTGRAAIWQGEFAYIADHPFLGSGYGTFADTGALSPLHNYVGDAWVQNVSHGHNAYLQLCVTIGGVGLALSLLVLVILPLRCLFGLRGQASIAFNATVFAVFAFMVFHNALESDFLEGDSPAWVAFLLMLAVLKGSAAMGRESRAAVTP
jgi:O-antigen ligase